MCIYIYIYIYTVVGLRPNHLVASSKIFPPELRALLSFWIRHQVSAARFSKTEQKGIATTGGDAQSTSVSPRLNGRPRPNQVDCYGSTALMNPALYPLLGFPEPQVLTVSHEVLLNVKNTWQVEDMNCKALYEVLQ